jgi:hypothetical protein
MRVSRILWQEAAAAATAASRPQKKLPLPRTFPIETKYRLLPSKTELLPSLINAPTTFAPVFIPASEEGRGGWFGNGKYLYRASKAWLTFYKTGLKQTRANLKLRKELKKELMNSLQYVKVPGSQMITMCRSEFQTMVRTKRDMMKLPRMNFYRGC